MQFIVHIELKTNWLMLSNLAIVDLSTKIKNILTLVRYKLLLDS